MGEALKLAIMGWHALQLALGVGVKAAPEVKQAIEQPAEQPAPVQEATEPTEATAPQEPQ
jgi:hypothetical protein